MTTQLNFEAPDELVRKIKIDAIKSGRSFKALSVVILSEFFTSKNWEERQSVYEKTPTKPTGRKLSLKKAA